VAHILDLREVETEAQAQLLLELKCKWLLLEKKEGLGIGVCWLAQREREKLVAVEAIGGISDGMGATVWFGGC